jgi:hypothetical protein
MAFAPPFVSTPGDPGRDSVQGRIARAATRQALQRNLERSLGAADDFLDDAPYSAPRSASHPTGSRFAEPAGSPAGMAHSPGRVIPVPVATVASPSHRDVRVNRDRSKGPAFDHLVNQSQALMKRLKFAHAHLSKSFGPNAPYMAMGQRLKGATSGLKGVAEALPYAEALLDSWDSAWGSQMHHLTRRCEGAELDCEKMRRQLTRALAEAEAAQAETEAYKQEMDANVDRIERAGQIGEECKDLRERLKLTDASRERERERLAGLQAAAAAAEERANAAVEERDRALGDLERIKASEAEYRNASGTAERELIELRSKLLIAERQAANAERHKHEADDARHKLEAANAAALPLTQSLEREISGRKAAEALVADAVDARKAADERAKQMEDLSVNARTRFKEWEETKASLEDELAAVRQEAAAAKEQHASKQLELHEKVMGLTDALSDAKARLGESETFSKAPAEAKRMEEASRRLRRDLAAAERVRFTANMVAGTARGSVEAAAMDGDDDALDEVVSAGGVVGSAKADAIREMASQMAAMRQELKAIKTQAGPRSPPAAPAPSHHETPAMEPAPQPQPQPQPHESAPFAPVHSNKENSRPSPTAESVELDHLRRQLELANSTIGVLRETRDQAMLSHLRFARPNYNPTPLLGPSALGLSAYPQPNFSAVNTPAGTPVAATRHTLAPPPTAPPGSMAASGSTPFPAGSAAERAYLHPDLVAARAEADRIVTEAEARGKESLLRLEAMAARLEKPPSGDLSVREVRRDVDGEEEDSAWGAKRETPSRTAGAY